MESNRSCRSNKVGIHLGQRGCGSTALREGRGRFYPIEEAELGSRLPGEHLLHLQCHFGSRHPEISGNKLQCPSVLVFPQCDRRRADDWPVSWAWPTGLISSLPDLYNAPAAIAEPATSISCFVSWGAICWLPDIRR